MTTATPMATLGNARAIERSAVPELPIAQLQEAILTAVAAGQRVASLFAARCAEAESVRLYVVIADDRQSRLRLASVSR